MLNLFQHLNNIKHFQDPEIVDPETSSGPGSE